MFSENDKVDEINEIVRACRAGNDREVQRACDILFWNLDCANQLERAVQCFDEASLQIFGDRFVEKPGQFDVFREELAKILKDIHLLAQKESGKAVYFEYYDDGDFRYSCFDVCSRYDDVYDYLEGFNEKRPDWTDYSVTRDAIEGPAVDVFMDAFSEKNLDLDETAALYFFCEWYAHALLLREFLHALAAEGMQIPFAFAKHDFAYVRLIK